MDQKDSYVSGERQSKLDVLMLKDPLFFSNFARFILQVDVVSQIIRVVFQRGKKLEDTAQIEDQPSLHSYDVITSYTLRCGLLRWAKPIDRQNSDNCSSVM